MQRLPCGGATTTKTRVRAKDHALLRLDEGGPTLLKPTADTRGLLRRLLASADAVLVSDYGQGITHSPYVRQALATTASRVPVVWDPHPRGAAPLPATAVVTPNLAEARQAAAAGLGAAESATAQVAQLSSILLQQWGCAAVIVTTGEHGALLQERHSAAQLFAAPHVQCVDPCGAGDQFAATVTLELAHGRPLPQAVQTAVATASSYVSAGGASRLQFTDHSGQPAGHSGAVPERESPLAWRLEELRRAGKTVVATGGCFDLLHVGHLATLQAARQLGDFLVVVINSDASVQRLKGAPRPLVSAPERAQLLGALECVDAVTIFTEDTPSAILRELRPDIWVKGGDYVSQELPETALVESWGGQVIVVPYVAERSTSKLVQRIHLQQASPTTTVPTA